MTNYHAHGWVDDSLTAPGNQSWQGLRVNKRGEVRVIDFIAEMLQQGRGYQVRLGTIATGVAVDSTLTDQAAELCYDAATGLTIIPIQLGIAAREIATALTFQAALKGVGAVSSAGTAFTPLPLLQGGSGASGSARAANNGGVTVTAELATTTRRIFEYELVNTHTPTTFKAGLDTLTITAAAAQLNYIGVGPACVYLQLAATTAFPLTFSHLNVIEVTSESLS
jgi:hypothetical protein